ncbi:MAG: TlpA family protein disulfide reductase [Ignavibacteriae bacterium]|nr:MAG: TlpA family protein disulfide reductase [Ignavibacteriota bacterium]
MNIFRFLFLLSVLSIPGCRRQMPVSGNWTGTMTTGENKQIPFQFFLEPGSPGPAGYFINGPERTPIPEIQIQQDSLTFFFSEYGAAMRGTWDGSTWRGKFFRYRSDTSWNAFVATPTSEGREPAPAAIPSGLSLSGKFQVYLPGDHGTDSTTTAIFWMRHDSLFGTLIAPDGDYGLLAGTQTGSHVSLSRFTGWQAFLLELDRQDTHWTGRLAARSGKPMVFTLGAQPAVPSTQAPSSETSMKNPKAPLKFWGMTSSGRMMNSDDELLRKKVLVIDIMGTWCHNCMDAAPLLQQLYHEFGKDGLVVVGLSFEISGNPETAKKNLALFQARYGLTYPVLFCGSTDKMNVQQRLHSQLNGFSGYPTTIFTDRNSIVKRIHIGFDGPGTGEGYQHQVGQYYEIVKKLLK